MVVRVTSLSVSLYLDLSGDNSERAPAFSRERTVGGHSYQKVILRNMNWSGSFPCRQYLPSNHGRGHMVKYARDRCLFLHRVPPKELRKLPISPVKAFLLCIRTAHVSPLAGVIVSDTGRWTSQRCAQQSWVE